MAILIVEGPSDDFEIVPIIPYDEEDEIIHTDEYPLCEDETCPCKQAASGGAA